MSLLRLIRDLWRSWADDSWCRTDDPRWFQ